MSTDGYDTWGKICIVTGSAGGIGKEICNRLLSNKAKVCVSDLNENLGKETTEEFQDKYGKENVTFCRYMYNIMCLFEHNIIYIYIYICIYLYILGIQM